MSMSRRDYPPRFPCEPIAVPSPDACWVRVSRGKWTLVDEAIAAKVIAVGRWTLGSHGYVYRNPRVDGRQTTLALHAFVVGERSTIDVDHENRDKLDNRRNNLRPATRQQNLANRRATGTSGFKGVSWHSRRQKWRATIKVNYRQRHLGLFAIAVDAARAYDAAAREAFGEFALVNFPGER